jgi:hypothetical protein
MTGRTAMVRLLWAGVRRVPEGEACLRDAVERINDRDGTNASAKGTDDYRSTTLLNDQQLFQLAHHFRKLANLPATTMRKRGPKGGRPRRPDGDPQRVTYLATQGERDYLDYLCSLLGVDATKRETFIDRQTKGRGLTTHAALTAVISPLESMLRRRGYELREEKRSKRWIAPEGADGTARKDP